MHKPSPLLHFIRLLTISLTLIGLIVAVGQPLQSSSARPLREEGVGFMRRRRW